jgi:hypothetical protein
MPEECEKCGRSSIEDSVPVTREGVAVALCATLCANCRVDWLAYWNTTDNCTEWIEAAFLLEVYKLRVTGIGPGDDSAGLVLLRNKNRVDEATAKLAREWLRQEAEV